jgi:hypothetical protein
MPSLIHFACSECGKRMLARPEFAGRRTLCRACGHKVRVTSLPCWKPAALTSLVAAPFSPPPQPAVGLSVKASSPRRVVRNKGSRLALVICVPLVVLGLLANAYLGWTLESEREAELTDQANVHVAQKVEAARGLMAHQEWGRAIAILGETLSTEMATDWDQARALLHEARHAQAQAIIAAAEAAIETRDLTGARTLLEEYLTHPQAAEKTRAQRLIDETDLAVSDARALALLKALPEPALAAFAQGGEPAFARQVENPNLRDIYTATLRRNLGKAQAWQDAQRLAREKKAREDYARRVARARAAPAFREVQELAARIRTRDAQNRKRLEDYDRQLVEATGAALTAANVNNRGALQQQAAKVKDDQERAMQAIDLWKDQVEEQISKTRANVKERIRAYKGFSEADCIVFDCVVDAELDGVLKELRKTAEEDAGGL